MSDNEVNIVVTATDRASSILLGVNNALRGMTGAISEITQGYIKYGDQVGTLSRFIGVSNEQSSRLIQLADDAFVEFDTLRMAAKNLSEKGLQPSTENLAKLSDEFLKMKPGLERSQFLVDKFGRSGMEMSKIMELGGDKIKSMSAAISDSLIIDDKKAAAILKTKQQVDEFNDALQGTKYDIAAKLLDIFAKMPKPLQDTVQILGVVGQSGLLQQLANMSILVSNLGGASGLGAAAAGMKAFAASATAAFWPVAGLALVLGEVWNISQNIAKWKAGGAMPDQGGMTWNNSKDTLKPKATQGFSSAQNGISALAYQVATQAPPPSRVKDCANGSRYRDVGHGPDGYFALPEILHPIDNAHFSHFVAPGQGPDIRNASKKTRVGYAA
ncbi:hypothetical protein CCP3SC15_400001 [Gammaproteobacteria bacterium]